MKRGNRVKLTRDLPILPTGGVLAAGSVGVVLDTGRNNKGEALALVGFAILDHAQIVVDCARLRVIR